MNMTSTVKNLSSTIAIILCTTALTACGGGGGSGSDSSSSNGTTPNTDTKPNTGSTPTDTCNSANANSSDKPDLDKDGIVDDCDTDIDGDGVVNTKDARPKDATIAGISKRVYKGYGWGNIDANSTAYFNAKKELVREDYVSSIHPDTANHSKRFTYDDKGRLIRLEVAKGTDKGIDRIEVWVYNQKNQLIEYKVNSNGDSIFDEVTTYQYNSNGDLTKIVETDTEDSSSWHNKTKEFIYNSQNQLKQITTDNNNDGSIDEAYEVTFDANNYLTKSMRYTFEGDDNTQTPYYASTYTYDDQGNVLKTTSGRADYEGDMDTITYRYDAQKHLVRRMMSRYGSNTPVIDTKVTYNGNLATGSVTTFNNFDSSNVQDVSNRAEYNSSGFLTKVTEDVSLDGKIDKEITYSYEGSVPLHYNIAPFLNLGESFVITPTAKSVLSDIPVNYTADTIKNSCYIGYC